jgi:Na+/H+-dicarboxylate symporter/ABC-type amino acid transport substrate-binding protein
MAQQDKLDNPTAVGKSSTKRRFGLAEQVLVGLVLGLATGVFFGEMAGALKIVGDAFIMLLQVTVIPYITVSLITALGQLTLEDAKTLGLRAGGVLLVLWAIGLVVVLLTPLAFPNWPSASFFSTSQVEETKSIDFLRLYIPANPFASLANAVVPAIVVFSVLIGLALINVKNKNALLAPLTVISDVLMEVTGFIAKLAPYGVFALTAGAAGTLDLEALNRLQVYLVVYVVLAVILTFWLLPALVTIVTPLRYGEILRAFRGPLVTAFATGNILVVLPLLAADSKRLIGEGEAHPSRSEEREARSSIDVLIPAAYNFPNLGLVLALMFVLFAGWYIGAAVPVSQYPVVFGAGLASLFGGTVLAIPFLLDLLKLPQDLFQVFITVDVLGSRFGTILGVMTIVTIALIGTYALQGRTSLRVVPLLRFAGITIALLAGALIGIRAFYTYVVVAPYTKDQALRALHLLVDPQPATVHREIPANLERAARGPVSLTQITKRGVLRVCYLGEDYPSSYFNESGKLVGFDIELMHWFARGLKLALEFVPVKGDADKEAARLLNAGVCDVFSANTGISPGKVARFDMTVPVYSSSVGLLVRDDRRDEFQSWDKIRALGDSLQVAIPSNPEAIGLARILMPHAVLVPLGGRGEMQTLLESGAPGVDAIGGFSENGAAWTLLYPRFSLVVPKPPLFVAVGYLVARGNQSVTTALNAFLVAAKSNGTVDKLYRYWMLGEAAKTDKPPRWSVIRDILGWVK